MVKTRELDSIQMHPYAWKPVTPRKRDSPVYGWDTETRNGYAKLATLSTPKQDYALRLEGFQDFVNMAMKVGCNNAINFFYNVDFDFSATAKWMGPTRLRELAAIGYTPWKNLEVGWIPNKAFTISTMGGGQQTRGKVYRFYDLAQFYDKKPLKEVALIVGRKKLEFDVKEIDFDRFDSDPKYQKKLLSYAYEDSVICRLAGERLHNAVNRVVPITHYFSTASVAQTYFLAHIPDNLRLPSRQVMEAALLAYGGGRFELIRRGYFPKVWEADINSAYPYEMSKLLGITSTGKWRHVKNSRDDSALYGFYLIRTTTHDTLLSPIMLHQQGSILYPHGSFKKWVEQSEIRMIERMGFKVKILEGYEYFDAEPTYPFQFIKSRLYPERMRWRKEKAEDLVYVYKIIPNSAYGKTIQLVPNIELMDELPIDQDENLIVKEIEEENGHVRFAVRDGWKAGRMFNPVYACAITARVRTRILETVYRHNLEKSLIGSATDAIFLKRAPPNSIVGNELGEWKLEVDSTHRAKPGLFIGSGVYAIRRAKKIFDPITKTEKEIDVNHYRGFITKKSLFDHVVNGFIVTQENGEERRGIRFDMTIPVKLKEGVRGSIRTTPTGEEQITWKDIAVFKPIRKVLDLNFDKKRIWERSVRNPQELLSNEIGSKPLVIQ